MDYVILAFSALAYGTGIVMQAVAAQRTAVKNRIDIGLLARLAGDRLYLAGFTAQVIGFALAFLARANLPLFLVQAGSAAAIGVAAVVGGLLLGWRITTAEILALGAMAIGLALLVGAASPGPVGEMRVGVGIGLVLALVLAVGVAAIVARMSGSLTGVALGVLAGAGFAVLAVASRPLAAGPLLLLPLEPLAWLMVVAALVGQGLLASALQRASTLTVMVAVESTAAVVAALVGLAAVGDQVVPGREAWVAAGLTLVVSGVVGLAAKRSGPEHRTPQEAAALEEEVTTG